MDSTNHEDAKKLSKSSIERSNGIDSINQKKTDSNDNEELEEVLFSLDYFQTILISGQKSFKEYESVSEYSNCDSLEVLPPHKWKGMSLSDMSRQLSIINENFIKFLTNILDKMRTMDGAVSRLRNDNEKLIDQIKINHIKKDIENERLKYGSLKPKNQIDIVESENKKLKKKIKEIEEKISEEETTMQSEMHTFKSKIKQLKHENKKLREEIEDLNEKDENECIVKEIKAVQKQLKELSTDCIIKDNESKTDLKDIERMVSRISEKNTETLVTLINEKNEVNQKLFDKSISEMKIMRSEMERLKDISRQGPSENEWKSFEELKEKEKKLIEEIESLKKTNNGMKVAMENVKQKLEVSVNNEKLYKEENEELQNVISDLKKKIKEMHNVKDEADKKSNAIAIMKEKIQKLNDLVKNAEKYEEVKIQLDESHLENEKLQGAILHLRNSNKERSNECEGLKKETLRLQKEMENMKKLNFSKKIGK